MDAGDGRSWKRGRQWKGPWTILCRALEAWGPDFFFLSNLLAYILEVWGGDQVWLNLEAQFLLLLLLLLLLLFFFKWRY